MQKTFAVLIAAFVSAAVWAQMNPRGAASLEGAKVTIDYGRPSAKRRDVFSMIQPGSYWRMGADNATKLKTEVPLLIGGGRIEKGEYTLVGQFASPEEFQLIVAIEGKPADAAIVLSWAGSRIRMPFKIAS